MTRSHSEPALPTCACRSRATTALLPQPAPLHPLAPSPGVFRSSSTNSRIYSHIYNFHPTVGNYSNTLPGHILTLGYRLLHTCTGYGLRNGRRCPPSPLPDPPSTLSAMYRATTPFTAKKSGPMHCTVTSGPEAPPRSGGRRHRRPRVNAPSLPPHPRTSPPPHTHIINIIMIRT